jgi:hypothetical protein
MNSRNFAVAASVLACVAMLSACAGTTSGHANPVTPVLPAVASASATPSTSAPVPTDNRGFIPKELGQTGGLGASDGSDAEMMSFSIDKITIDPKCDEYGSRDAGMHTVVVDVRVSTVKLADGDAGLLSGLLNPYSFQTYDAEGVSHPSQMDMCLMGSKSPSPNAYASNSKYRFQIVFGTDTVPVEIVLASSNSSGNAGWVWKVK